MSAWNSPDDPFQTVPPLPRSVAAFAAVAVGMLVAREGPTLPAAMWFALASGAGALVVLTRGRVCKAALLAGALFLGAGTFSTRILERPADSLSAFIDDAPPDSILTVEGLAIDDPRAPAPSGALARFAHTRPRGVFTLDTESVLTDRGPLPVSGTLRVQVPGSTWSASGGLSGFPVRAGQRVRVTGVAHAIEPPLNPGEADFRLYAAQDSLAGGLDVESAPLVQVLAEDEALLARLRASFHRARESLRSRARTVLDPGPTAEDGARALVLSLFLGVDEGGQGEVRRAFTHIGLAHVLAISGFHLTVMAYVALFLVRLTGDRGMLEPAIVAALLVLYLLAVPASAPVIRSGLLALALMGAEACGRRYSALAVLGWVGITLILWRPMDLWGLGFQLSLGLTGLLLWIGRYVHVRIFGPTILGLVRRPRALPVAGALFALEHVKTGVSSSLLCWSAAAPLIAFRTGLVSPYAIVTTLIVLPPVVALMVVGYVVLLVGLVWPDAASFASGVLLSLAGLNVWLVGTLDQLPGSGARVPPLGVLWVGAATTTTLWWFLRGHARHAGVWAATVAVLLWLAADLGVAHRRASRVALRLDALAVGDASCVILRSQGRAVLWNCGSDRTGAGERAIPGAARALGAWRIPTVVVSAPDLSHLSALLDAAEPLGVRRVVVMPTVLADAESHPEGPAAFTLRELRRAGVEVVEGAPGTQVEFGIASLRCIEAPIAGSTGGARPAPLGAVVEVRGVPGARALLAGDMDERSLARLLDARADTTAPVIELPLRGAVPSTTAGGRLRAAFIACRADDARALAASDAYSSGLLYLTGLDGAFFAEFDTRGDTRAGSEHRPGGAGATPSSP